MKSSRRRSRELALQELYAWQLGGASLESLAAHAAEQSDYPKADEAFFRKLLSGVLGAADELRGALEPQIDRPWKELSPVERGVLLLAAYELKYLPEIPFRVIVNEAIELAKAFGGTQGHKFVNGVLDRVAKRLRPGEGA